MKTQCKSDVAGVVTVRLLCALGCALILGARVAQAGTGELEETFRTPPASARPGVWWRWISGNVSKEGITRDLSEMARQGIGSVELFGDVTGGPHRDLRMMGPQWRELFRHTLSEADRLGIEIRMQAAAGWGLGGPWIDSAVAAKRLEYTEVQVDGPCEFAQVLPQPVVRAGYYRDVAVLAVPARPGQPPRPVIRASSTEGDACDEWNFPPDDALDGDPATTWHSLAAPKPGAPQWLEYAFPAPITACAVQLASPAGAGPRACILEASDDGRAFRRLGAFELEAGAARRMELPPTTARVFRLVMESAHVGNVQLGEFWVLRQGDSAPACPGIKWWMFKSGNRAFWAWPREPAAVMDEEYDGSEVADACHDDVRDLTGRMQADGRLSWSVPPGRWTLLRFGVTQLAEPPRAAQSGGWEPDPFSRAAADRIFDATAGRLQAEEGGVAQRVLRGILFDSYEMGVSWRGLQPNWTDTLRQEFRARRGYDPLPYWPALTRRVIDSRKTTDRFLWDWRQTLGELYLEFYGRLAERAHACGMTLTAQCGYGTYPFPNIDGLAAYGRTDVPEGEIWFRDGVMSAKYPLCDTIRTAASAAHTYGLSLVAAESLTAGHGYRHAPADYKPALETEFCQGLTRCMLHMWSQQSDVTARPGLATYELINGNLTWWPHAQPFLASLARTQHLLRQGKPVVDFAYFFGEGTSKFVPGRAFVNPAVPEGYEFDGINAEVILNRLQAHEGALSLPDGMSYRYLVLPHRVQWAVSPAVLDKIAALVRAGATVIGPPPGAAPGLTDQPASDRKVAQLAHALWGSDPGLSGDRKVGKGRVIWGQPLGSIVAGDGLSPDVAGSLAGGLEPGGRAGLAKAQWIWHKPDGANPPPGERVFRSVLDIPQGCRVASVRATMAADNRFSLLINGAPVGSGQDFSHPADVSIDPALLHGGSNSILVRATNDGTTPNPAGLIGKMVVTLEDGRNIVKITDGEGWQSSAGGDSWSHVSAVAPLGGGPWGQLPSDPVMKDNLQWAHRRDGATDIYLLSNPNPRPVVNVPISLRVAGSVPDLFDPVTGRIQPLPEFKGQGRCTVMPLSFAPQQAYFIVFQGGRNVGTVAANGARNFPALKPVVELGGPWTVSFDPAWMYPLPAAATGAVPGQVVFDRLGDWSQRPEPGIRHYSGRATYQCRFELSPEILEAGKGRRLFISLGEVQVTAKVKLNGQEMGVAWCPPWKVEITSGLKAGINQLEIEVANLWMNRLIGDESLPAAERRTRTNFSPERGAPLLPSGLLGPVEILQEGGLELDSAAFLARIAGIYTERFRNALVDGTEYESTNTLEVVPIDDQAAYIRMHLEFINGNEGAIEGVAIYGDHSLIYDNGESGNDRCVVEFIWSRDKVVTAADYVKTPGCSKYHGFRGSFCNEVFKTKERQAIRDLRPITDSPEFKAALDRYRQRSKRFNSALESGK